MKRIGWIVVTAAMLLALSVFPTTAAEQNHCARFEQGITDLAALQTEDVTEGGQFADVAVLVYTLWQTEDVRQYESEEEKGVYLLPQETFETEAKRHFDVETAQLHALKQDGRAVYDAENGTYSISDCVLQNPARYMIRGYQKRGDIYTAYYSQVEDGYEKTQGAVEGEDYLLDYQNDPKGVPLKLTDKHLKVTFTYAGGVRRFRSWTHLRELPSLNGMTTPTKPEQAVIGTQKTTRKSQTTTVVSTTVQTKDVTTQSGTEKTTQKASSSAAKTTTRTTIKNGRVTGAENAQTILRTTIPTEPLEVLFQQDGVLIQAPASTFPEETVLSAILLQGVADDVAQRALRDRAAQMVVYDVFATKSGKQIQPSGRVNVTFAIPEGYEPSRTAVVYIAAGGTAEILVSKVDVAAGAVSADITNLGTVVVAELYTADVANGPNMVLVGVVLLALAAVAATIWQLRRKSSAEETENAAETEKN